MVKKVLVVDDEPYIARVIRFKLEQEGFTVISAGNGLEGLQRMKEEKPDLVILDVMMPGMDGFEVYRQMKEEEELKKIPVIILTAKGQEVDRQKGLELGAADYITKPFSPTKLLQQIKTIVGESEK
ncbi:MAG: response regulator [Candidatus Edwardsbacteria bacterium]